jgi:aryl-alcohol dehydrogenase-like predicted oxidoreductase
MKYRRLGGTDLDVSVVCLGPMRAAAKEPGTDEKSSAGELALRRPLDLGVNFLHSSYEYGTRWMMGRVLKDHPKRAELHHIIKVLVPDFTDGDRFDPAKFRLRPDGFRRSSRPHRGESRDARVTQPTWATEDEEET